MFISNNTYIEIVLIMQQYAPLFKPEFKCIKYSLTHFMLIVNFRHPCLKFWHYNL
jgi:hypothetical protein